MPIDAHRIFLKRVQVALGWTLLVGLTASVCIVPSQQHSGTPAQGAERTAVLEQSMVVPRTTPSALVRMPSQERVQTWFRQFDGIRQRAQMSSEDKSTAVRLWACTMLSSKSINKNDGITLLTSMVSKYDRANKEMAALPEIPETKSLQQGYARFFKQADINFHNHLLAFKTKSTKEAVDEMSKAKNELSSLDCENKSLDHDLRKQYAIAELN